MSSTARRWRELRELLQSDRAHRVYGAQVSLVGHDEVCLTWVKVSIHPSDGPYHGGSFLFKIQFPHASPRKPPCIECLTPIFHPNIDHAMRGQGSNVCLSLLDHGQWQEHFGLEECLQALLFLLHSPNLEDPFSPFFWGGIEDHDNFEDKVRRSLLGEEVDGVQFNRNYFNSSCSPEDADVEVEPVSTIKGSLYFGDCDQEYVPRQSYAGGEPNVYFHQLSCSVDDPIPASSSEDESDDLTDIARVITLSAVKSATEDFMCDSRLELISEERSCSSLSSLKPKGKGLWPKRRRRRPQSPHCSDLDLRSNHSCAIEGPTYMTCTFTAPDYDYMLHSLTRVCWGHIKTFLYTGYS